jgi:adenylate cyclase
MTTSKNIEIERKFLVDPVLWDQFAKPAAVCIIQGYIKKEHDVTVRIRVELSNKSYLTIKGKTEGISRPEYEYEIPFNEALEMLKLFCNEDQLIHKRRYNLENNFIVDVFDGKNKGLIIAEVELSSPEELYVQYTFLREEISTDRRYTNAKLSEHPYSEW